MHLRRWRTTGFLFHPARPTSEWDVGQAWIRECRRQIDEFASSGSQFKNGSEELSKGFGETCSLFSQLFLFSKTITFEDRAECSGCADTAGRFAGHMNSAVPNPDSPPMAAGIAGSMKMLLMVIVAVICLGGGIGLGLLLKTRQVASPDSHVSAEGDQTDAGADEPAHDFQPVDPLDDDEHLDENLAKDAGDHETQRPSPKGASPEARPGIEGGEKSHSDSAAASRPLAQDGKRPQNPGSQLLLTIPEHAEELNPFALDPKDPPSERLLQADKLMMVGNYRHALEAYRSIVESVPTFLPADLSLRLGLCHEAEGNFRLAQADYRKVIELNGALELQEAAILGMARLWNQAGRSELAIATLFRAILNSGRQQATLAQSQIPHELAVMLSQRVRKAGREDLTLEDHYDDDVLVSPTLRINPFSVITELSGKTLTAPGTQLIAPNDLSVVERFSEHPDEIYVNVRSGRLTALELVRRLANRCGLKVQITEEARLRLQDHSLSPDCKNVPLSIALDALLEPYEILWSVKDDSLFILLARSASTTDLSTYRMQAALRSLRFAIRSASLHPWTAASSLELARLKAQTGKYVQAADYLKKMLENFPRSQFESIAWYNLGKLELLQGNLDAAMGAFQNAADHLSGHPLESMAYLYLGRIQMENDHVRESIPAYTRALILGVDTEFESMAVLQLSSAYLMLDHYQRANEILVEHKAAVAQAPARDQAAFLVCLIQYLSTTDKNERFRAGTTLLGAMTRLEIDHSFACHWHWLAARAYRDFGMKQQQVAVLRLNVKSPYPYPFQSRIRMMLLEDAPHELAGLQPLSALAPARGKPSDLFFKTQLREADHLFQQGQSDAAMQVSRDLAEHPHISDNDRRAALRLMGRIYQARGQHELAIQCFSGIVPSADPIHIPPTAALPIPEHGVQ